MLRTSVCVIVLCAFASTCRAAAEEVDYFAVFMDKAKAGHCIETRRVEDRKVFSSSTMTFTTERMGVPLSMTVKEEFVETTQGQPLSFKTVMDMSLMSQVVEGRISRDGKLTVTVGGDEQTMDWPQGALLLEGTRLLRKRQGMKEGITYSFVQFDATSLRGTEMAIRVIGKKPVDVLGKQENLWEVREESQGISSLFYYDDHFKVRKSLMAEGGMNLEVVACSKELALGQTTSVDLMARVILPSPGPLEGLGGAASVTYRLVPIGDAKLSVPSFDNQKVLADPSGLTVVVTAQKVPAAVAMPYAGDNKAALEAMKPTAYLDCDKAEIVALACQAAGGSANAVEAARRIEAFVQRYVISKGFDVGYARASEVVANRTGDCSEHAVLAAAMCRAVGIPARVVVGMAYTQDMEGQAPIFCPPAWVTVYLEGKWVNIDPTFPQGYDLGHIALADGDGIPADYLGLARVMGVFRIEAATIQPKEAQPPKAPARAVTSRRSSPD
ncbi:MAG: transglutaminase-like domain-containing protein [Phycisphaerae bacterium]|nr:transglutaminase-like domain-containing protein [Phycisphaerae bacterium]